jgi:hypothetical protein
MKTTVKKFRPELEEYIKRTNPSGYASKEAAPALVSINGKPH